MILGAMNFKSSQKSDSLEHKNSGIKSPEEIASLSNDRFSVRKILEKEDQPAPIVFEEKKEPLGYLFVEEYLARDFLRRSGVLDIEYRKKFILNHQSKNPTLRSNGRPTIASLSATYVKDFTAYLKGENTEKPELMEYINPSIVPRKERVPGSYVSPQVPIATLATEQNKKPPAKKKKLLLRDLQRTFSIVMEKETILGDETIFPEQIQHEALNQELLKYFISTENENIDDFNNRALKRLMDEKRSIPKLKVEARLMSGELLKDFSKYLIAKEFDFDLGIKSYCILAKSLESNFTRLRMFIVATHYACFSAEHIPYVFVKIAEICKKTRQPLALLQIFYLLSKLGKINVEEFEIVLKVLRDFPEIEEESINVVLEFNRERRNETPNLDPLNDILEKMMQKGPTEFGVAYETVKGFLDSRSYQPNLALSSESNLEKEKEFFNQVNATKKKFNSLIFDLAVQYSVMTYAKMLANDIMTSKSVSAKDAISVLRLAAKDINSTGYLTFLEEALSAANKELQDSPPEFFTKLVDVFANNFGSLKRYIYLIIPLLYRFRVEVDSMNFLRLIAILTENDQFKVLENVMKMMSVSRRKPVFSQQEYMSALKLINNCYLDSQRDNLLALLDNFKDSAEDENNELALIEQNKRALAAKQKKEIENLQEAANNKKDIIDPNNPDHADYVLLQKICDSRPLFTDTKLHNPKTKTVTRTSDRPLRDRRNIFEIARDNFLGNDLEGDNIVDVEEDMEQQRASITKEAKMTKKDKKQKKSKGKSVK